METNTKNKVKTNDRLGEKQMQHITKLIYLMYKHF